MGCGHFYSSEGITQLLEYCVSTNKAEIKCPAISYPIKGLIAHTKCNFSFEYNLCQ